MIRAKFIVQTVHENKSGFEIDMVPVVCGSKENENFFKWTPYGSLKMGIVSKEVAEKFRPGTEFYVDFTQFIE